MFKESSNIGEIPKQTFVNVESKESDKFVLSDSMQKEVAIIMRRYNLEGSNDFWQDRALNLFIATLARRIGEEDEKNNAQSAWYYTCSVLRSEMEHESLKKVKLTSEHTLSPEFEANLKNCIAEIHLGVDEKLYKEALAAAEEAYATEVYKFSSKHPGSEISPQRAKLFESIALDEVLKNYENLEDPNELRTDS